jgi:hypothetical protein
MQINIAAKFALQCSIAWRQDFFRFKIIQNHLDTLSVKPGLCKLILTQNSLFRAALLGNGIFPVPVPAPARPRARPLGCAAG